MPVDPGPEYVSRKYGMYGLDDGSPTWPVKSGCGPGALFPEAVEQEV
jgi:hypothetical protein